MSATLTNDAIAERFELMADLLEVESDPRYTIELLPDWERNWGLPDPCVKEPTTVGERRLALLQRMTMIGAQSRQFFIDLAASLGYTITITEYRTFVVGIDRVGDARVYGNGMVPMYNEWGNPWLDVLGNPVSGAALLWFRCGDGQCGIKPHLEFGEGEERELSEWPYWGLGPDTNRFYWTVHLEHGKIVWFRCASGQSGVDPHLIYIGPESRLIWFRCGVHQCGVDPLLFIRIADDLECLFNRWKPAHTHVLFDYSGLEQPGDPMGGTP